MIPKIIHYCWFGANDLPLDFQEYVSEWIALHPDWEIIKWDESNSPIHLEYLKNALANKKWANVSNYVRLYALLEYGGIYLDVDMKLIKPLDSLLTDRCFLGFEEGDLKEDSVFWVNNAIIGAEKKDPFISRCAEQLLESFDGLENANLSAPQLITKLLIDDFGLDKYGLVQVDHIKIYPKDYFYPIHYSQAYKLKHIESHLTENTIAVHTWGRSWIPPDQLIEMIDNLQYNLEVASQKLAVYQSSIARCIKEIDISETIPSTDLTDKLNMLESSLKKLEEAQFKLISTHQFHSKELIKGITQKIKDNTNSQFKQLETFSKKFDSLSRIYEQQRVQHERLNATYSEVFEQNISLKATLNFERATKKGLEEQIVSEKRTNEEIKKILSNQISYLLAQNTEIKNKLEFSKKNSQRIENNLAECRLYLSEKIADNEKKEITNLRLIKEREDLFEQIANLKDTYHYNLEQKELLAEKLNHAENANIALKCSLENCNEDLLAVLSSRANDLKQIIINYRIDYENNSMLKIILSKLFKPRKKHP